MKKIKELKELCKKMAHDIKLSNRAFKERQRGNLSWDDWSKLCKAHPGDSIQYRHMHVAYCLLRGTPYERIESKVLPGNEPNWDRIELIKTLYAEVPDVPALFVSPA